MKSKNVNIKKTKTTKAKVGYTRQNKDLYKAFLKADLKKHGPNTRTKLSLSGSKVNTKSRAKLDFKTSQYFFKRLSGRQWKYDKKTNSFKTIGRSPFNKATLEKYQKQIEITSKKFAKLLTDQAYGVLGDNEPTDKQYDVLASIYNSGLNLVEFKSKYQDDYERIFENDADEL